MTTKPKYFHTTVNAGSVAELKMRVDENISRGFEVVMEKVVSKSGTDWDVTDTFKGKKVYTSHGSREYFNSTIHTTLMRRENREL